MTPLQILIRVARGLAHRRLRRMAGTQSVAWAIRIPLVTLALSAVVVLVVARDGRTREG